ncbi:hypothetical protein [Streptomyces galbus]|nr:hypothetical protein [Streptomyces galbus]
MGSDVCIRGSVCAILSATTAATSAVRVHEDIEVAQGEAGG